VLGGVVSSTLLTLLVVPVVYTLLDGLSRGMASPPSVRLLLPRTPLAEAPQRSRRLNGR
jgi:hypothetical protein